MWFPRYHHQFFSFNRDGKLQSITKSAIFRFSVKLWMKTSYLQKVCTHGIWKQYFTYWLDYFTYCWGNKYFFLLFQDKMLHFHTQWIDRFGNGKVRESQIFLKFQISIVPNVLIIPHRSIHSHLFIHNNGLKLAKVKQHICYVHFWSFLGLFLESPCLNSVEVEIFAWHVCTFWNPYKKHYQKNLKLKYKL